MSQDPLEESKAEPPIFTAGYVRLLALQMAFGVSFSAFLLLPKFLKTELGASAAEIGAVTGTSLVGAALLAPVVGFIAHRFDRRWLLALALLLQGAAAFGFLLVKEVGPLAFVLRLIQGTAFVLVFNCTATLVADQVPRRHLARAVGYLGLAMLATNALAPALTEPVALSYGWPTAFVISGTCSLLALVLVARLDVFQPALTEEVLSGTPPSQLPIYYASLLVGAGLGCLFTFVQPYALEQGAERVGDFFFGYVASAVVVRVVFGSIPDRFGPRRVAAFAILLYSAVTISAAFVTPATLIPLGALLGISHGFIYPALSAAGLAAAAPGGRSVFMGWFGCAFNLGCAFSSLTMGPLADLYGYPAIFVATGLWVLTGAPVLFSQGRARAFSAAR